MNESKIDKELVAAVTLEITDRYKLLLTLIPKELNREVFLKHLAAASIHTAMFLRDFYDYIEGKKITAPDKNEMEFIDNCGCDMKEKDEQIKS